MAATLSDPCSCCVIPIDHTRIAVPADAYRRAKRSMSARDAPDCRSRSVKDSRSSSSSSASKSSVCSRTKRRSIPPSASSTFMTPLRNATSPPVFTPKNSSVIFVPNMALSTLLGTQ